MESIVINTKDENLRYEIKPYEFGPAACKWRVWVVTEGWQRTPSGIYDTAGEAVEAVLEWGVK